MEKKKKLNCNKEKHPISPVIRPEDVIHDIEFSEDELPPLQVQPECKSPIDKPEPLDPLPNSPKLPKVILLPPPKHIKDSSYIKPPIMH